MLKLRSFFSAFVGALALVFFVPQAAQAANAATVLSVSFNSADPIPHIGSLITVHMVVLDVSAQMGSVTTVSPASVTGLTLTSPDLASVVAAQVYVTDGLRTWSVAFGGGTSVSISNNNFVVPAASDYPSYWNVPSYVALQNQTYRIYTGTLITGSSAQVTANLGSFGNVTLNDAGSAPDLNPSNGVYSASYTVPDLGMSIVNSRIYGRAYYNNLSALNDFFQSPGTLTIDALRPQINSVLFSVPARLNYNNVLYLSANCQNTVTPDPTNAQGRFDLVVNKNNTVLSIVVGAGVLATPKTLPPVIIPAGSQTLNGWMVWDGSDGQSPPKFVADGIYPVTVGITDGYGVAGTTVTTQVRVTSMRFELSNIRLSPSGRQVQPTFTSGLITAISADIVAYRDGLPGLQPSMRALGWPLTNYATSNINGSVYSLQSVDFLNQAGTTAFGIDPLTQHDSNAAFDYDAAYDGFYNGITTTSDGSVSNDWDPVVLTRLTPTGGVINPTALSATYSVVQIGPSPGQGNYRLRLRARLTALMEALTASGLHYSPSINPDNGITTDAGQGIYAEDSSIIFQVGTNPSPISDNTPPVFLNSSPIDNSTIAPTVYGPPTLQALTAQFQDTDSAMDASGAKSYITVTDPQGGNVPGVSSTDGGGANNTLLLTFQPSVILNKGGLYKMTVNTCNNAGLCVSKDLKITVQDQTSPSVSAVELVPQVGSNIPLSINQGGNAEGPFQGVAGVQVTLSIPSTSTNTIDWTQSNVSLSQIVGGNRVPVTMTRLTTGTPTDGKLKYALASPINSAGLYEVSVQTFSKDAGGLSYVGPAVPPYTTSQFSTVLCLSCVTTLYAGAGSDPSRPAISAAFPLTLTAGGPSLDPLQVGVDAPSPIQLPTDSGYVHITSALFASAMRFYLSGVLQTTPLTWTYPLSAPVTFRMYYDDTDLPTGLAESSLVVRAYTNGSWTTQPSVVQNSLPSTSNSMAFSPTSSQPAAVYYAIAYASSTIVGAVASTPTPYLFKSTRSFNPSHANPIYRKARFYYSATPVKDIEVRIYDTGGTLLKSMTLGNGVKTSDMTTDPTTGNISYFFEWDGRNDSGNAAKNGLYLVRWRLTQMDGSGDTEVKPVALIR